MSLSLIVTALALMLVAGIHKSPPTGLSPVTA